MTPDAFFHDGFRLLSGGKDPFPWQQELFRRFLAGDSSLPSACILPTGVGKTSVLIIWLLALAWSIRDESVPRVPRRLAYVVNRRTVVDQATAAAENIRELLAEESVPADAKLAVVRGRILEALRLAAGIDEETPIAISALRGQFADNGEWSMNPAQPAIIVGTVDMIGSRLLFAGYRSGFKSHPHHAGLLGRDTLLVHDEAHLEPAFQQLIERIRHEQEQEVVRSAGAWNDGRRLQIMQLTATSRATVEPFKLLPDDLTHTVIRQRMYARKGLVLHAVDDEKQTRERIVELALEHRDSGQAVLIYTRLVNDVEFIAAELRKAGLQAISLTGTMRGHERDALIDKPEFRRFLDAEQVPESGTEPPQETVYLVANAAGEVGVDLKGVKHACICDLSTWESMAQRLGRINRLGDGDARIDVIHPTEFSEKDVLGPARAKTLELLGRLPLRDDGTFDASPHALSQLPEQECLKGFSPAPEILHAGEFLFDAWALTTIRGTQPGRPPVADWLHGVTDRDPPQTQIAWRLEVEWVRPVTQGADSSDPPPVDHRGNDSNGYAEPHFIQPFEASPRELFEKYPLKPHELLRDRSDRVFKHLERLAKKFPALPVWIVDAGGQVDAITLSKLVENKQPAIEHRTVLLPPCVGGLAPNGMLSGTAPPPARGVSLDVADQWLDDKGQPRRERIKDDEAIPPGMRVELRLLRQSEAEDNAEEEEAADVAGEKIANGKRTSGAPREQWLWCIRPKSADDDGSLFAMEEQELTPHLSTAGRFAAKVCAALELPERLQAAIVVAAANHDLGKDREVWQKGIGNRRYPNPVLAKSRSGKTSRPVNVHYRHELGSALDIATKPEFLSLDPDLQQLVLHMIAAHHGRARPHFPPDEVLDLQQPQEAVDTFARDTPARFARLQRIYGRWGLAWLESLVRSADRLASSRPEEEDGQ